MGLFSCREYVGSAVAVSKAIAERRLTVAPLVVSAPLCFLPLSDPPLLVSDVFERFFLLAPSVYQALLVEELHRVVAMVVGFADAVALNVVQHPLVLVDQAPVVRLDLRAPALQEFEPPILPQEGDVKSTALDEVQVAEVNHALQPRRAER